MGSTSKEPTGDQKIVRVEGLVIAIDASRSFDFENNLTRVCVQRNVELEMTAYATNFATAFRITLTARLPLVFWLMGWLEGLTGVDLLDEIKEHEG